MAATLTRPGYWGIGGALLSAGLLHPRTWGRMAATAGVFILAVKMAEALACVANMPSPRKLGRESSLEEEG